MKIAGLLATGFIALPYLNSEIKLYYSPDSKISSLLPNCELLTSSFVSTHWLNLGALQSYYGSSPAHLKTDEKSVENIEYTRELLTFPDGGLCSLDWVDKNSKKILVIIPGLTGGSEAVYIKHITLEGTNKGYDVVVINGRGISGTPLTVFI